MAMSSHGDSQVADREINPAIRILRERGISTDEAKSLVLQEIIRRTRERKIDFYEPKAGRQLEFHKSSSRERWCICGNRSGKTTAGCVELIWWCIGRHPYRNVPKPPIRAVVVSLSSRVQRSVVQVAMEKYLPLEHVRSISRFQGGIWDVVSFTNGSVIEFRSCESGREKFQGSKWHLAWFDEEPPQDIYTEVRRGLVDFGGSVIGTMTPVNGMTWSYEHIENNPDIEKFRWSMHDNPFLDPAEVAKFEQSLSPEERVARIHGRYTSFSGLVYPEFDETRHVADDLAVESGDVVVCGIDTGRCFAAVWCAFGDDICRVIGEVYLEDRTISECVEACQLMESQLGITPAIRFIDRTSQFIRDLTDMGYATCFGRQDVLGGISVVRSWLANGKIRISRSCQRLLWEIRRYRWDWHSRTSKVSGQLKDKPLKVDDHCVDALRYAFSYVPDREHPLQEKPSAADQISRIMQKFLGDEVQSRIVSFDEYGMPVQNTDDSGTSGV